MRLFPGLQVLFVLVLLRAFLRKQWAATAAFVLLLDGLRLNVEHAACRVRGVFI